MNLLLLKISLLALMFFVTLFASVGPVQVGRRRRQSNN